MDRSFTKPHWSWLPRALQPTRWSLVQKLRGGGSGTAPAEEFCRGYWFPMYSFLRHSGYGREEAQDHVQTFFVRLLDEDLLAGADSERGRMRNFLFTLLARHVAARREKDAAQKRGGVALHVPLDWEAAEASFQQQGRFAESPEEASRGALAAQLVHEGIAALRKRYHGDGRGALFEELLPSLEGPLPEDTYAAAAARLGMKPAAVRTAALRMRERFRRVVLASAAVLLGIPEGPLLDAELRELFCGATRHSGV